MKLVNWNPKFSDAMENQQTYEEEVARLEGGSVAHIDGGASSGGGFNWSDFFNALPGSLNGVGNILGGVGGIKNGGTGGTSSGTGADTSTIPQKNNTGLYIGLGVGAITLLGIIYFLVKKK